MARLCWHYSRHQCTWSRQYHYWRGFGGHPNGVSPAIARVLLLPWLVMEDVCPMVTNAHIALSDNNPTVHWVQWLATKHSKVAMALIRTLAIWLHITKTLPLIPLDIAGVNNVMTDTLSRLFGSDPKWHCCTNEQFLTLFNSTFPLPLQRSWTLSTFPPQSVWEWFTYCRRGISLWTNRGNYQKLGKILELLGLLRCTFGSGPTSTKNKIHTGDNNKSKLEQLIAWSWPLARRYLWSQGKLANSDKLIPQLALTLDWWQKEDPPTLKKLPVEADVPELLSHIGSCQTSWTGQLVTWH